jgi:hypothetical protein
MWRDPWGYNNRIFEQIDKEFSDAEDMLNRMFRTVRESSAGIPETAINMKSREILLKTKRRILN